MCGGKTLWMRITPAHAGKTPSKTDKQPTEQDHPRSRGENYKTGFDPGYFVGSPPLTRGKRARGMRKRSNMRITPAHAGKTIY